MKESKVLKVISYILLPVFTAIIIISIVYTFTKESYEKNLDSYFDTTSFTRDYANLLSRLARNTIYLNEEYTYYIEDGKYKIYDIDLNNYDYDVRLKDSYVIIIYKNKVITNLVAQGMDTLEEMKNFIAEQERRKITDYKW